MDKVQTDTSDLYIIDALGPFFVETENRDVINWSKVIFSDLETDSRLSIELQATIIAKFDTYITHVAGLGYNSVSMDDLAHLVCFPFYNLELQTLLGDYKKLYKKLFDIAKSRGMKIFINTDYLFFNKDIDNYLRETNTAPHDFYINVLKKAMDEFPEIDGVILRMGEKDGMDVSGNFISQLLLHTPRQANTLLRNILPLFEQTGKTLIFRTWTIGAYKVGDLIWNADTYNAVFASIDSDALIISMKYGDTDFMRHLALNPLFSNGSHKKILELQTRREWEGMGTYPSFVGWDYDNYLKELSLNPSVIGIHVWCQTGGWAKKEWTNLTYLDGSSFWNELNTEVTIGISRHHQSVEEAVTVFCKTRNITEDEKFIELLRQSEIAIKKGLYISELAQKELYFRRSRVPPLMWLTWDRVHLPAPVVYLHRMLLPSNSTVIKDGQIAIEACKKMLSLANELGLNKKVLESLEFELATLIIFEHMRHYILRPQTALALDKLNKHIQEYEKNYPQHYDIGKLASVRQRRLPRSTLKPFLRESATYRKRDKLFLKTSSVQARLVRYYLKKSRSHLADQSMGLETLFK